MAKEAPQWWWTKGAVLRRPKLWPAWPLLRIAAACYRRVITARNNSYDSKLRRNELFRPPVPTIGIGNITVGGSGKTPLAIWLARLLQERGLRPAIIARGYGAARGILNDEMLLAARKCPDATVLANPDRQAAITDAVRLHSAKVILLDDAFQHRRVRRDLDIVLVDATRGFGNGHMLPAGPLREPIESLRRADLVLLTRTEQVPPERLSQLCEQIQQRARQDLPIGRIAFQPSGLIDLQFSPAARPAGPVGLFAGIGNFAAFAETCRRMGMDIAGQMPLSDHQRYDLDLCKQISQRAQSHGFACLVTTEKDAVKVSQIDWDWPVPVRVVSIETVPDEPTRALLDSAIDAALQRKTAKRP